MTDPTTKICRRCGVERLVVEFGEEPRHRDGLRSHCNACRREEARLRRQSARGVTPASDQSIALRHARESAQSAPVAMERDVVRSGLPGRSVCENDDLNAGVGIAGPTLGQVGSGESAPSGTWPRPLDPAKYPPALVERRLKTIATYARLDAQPPATGKPGPTGWRRRVFGDGRGGPQ